MVYITEWSKFCEESKKLYDQAPQKVRYTMKYRHCDGKLVLKVTDDSTCLKYRTDSAADLKRVEEFNMNILETMVIEK